MKEGLEELLQSIDGSCSSFQDENGCSSGYESSEEKRDLSHCSGGPCSSNDDKSVNENKNEAPSSNASPSNGSENTDAPGSSSEKRNSLFNSYHEESEQIRDVSVSEWISGSSPDDNCSNASKTNDSEGGVDFLSFVHHKLLYYHINALTD